MDKAFHVQCGNWEAEDLTERQVRNEEDCIIYTQPVKQTSRGNLVITGADPEILHGRWLMGWLPIANHTGAMGVAGA